MAVLRLGEVVCGVVNSSFPKHNESAQALKYIVRTQMAT